MVTKMNESRKSINDEPKGKPDAKVEAFHKELATRAKDRVTNAIKARKDSFVTMHEAACSAILLGIQFGRFEQFNRLFRELPSIDGEAVREKFVAQVVEKFGSGGVWNAEKNAWDKRPVAFIVYRTDKALADMPETEKGQNFALRSTKNLNAENPDQKATLEHIQAGRQAVIDGGEDALMTIDWLDKAKMVNTEREYGSKSWKADLIRVLKRGLRLAATKDSGVVWSTIEAIMRDANIDSEDQVDVRKRYQELASNTNASNATVATADPRGTADSDTNQEESTNQETVEQKAA